MKLRHLLAIAALSLPFSAQANYSYSYLEVGYRAAELADQDGDGFDIEVNFLLGDLLYFSADMEELEYDSDLHFDRFSLGLGAHFNVMQKVDLYGVLSYVDLEFDIPAQTDIDDKGWGYELGARYKLNDDWEFRLAGDFATYEGKAAEIETQQLIATAVYNLSPNYAVVGEYIGGELNYETTGQSFEEQGLRVGLRVQF